MRRAELTDPQCVVKIGSGRGFIVEQRRLVCDPLRRFVKNRRSITAGHCLPNLPIAFADSSIHGADRTEILSFIEPQTRSLSCGFLAGHYPAGSKIQSQPDKQLFFTGQQPLYRLARLTTNRKQDFCSDFSFAVLHN